MSIAYSGNFFHFGKIKKKNYEEVRVQQNCLGLAGLVSLQNVIFLLPPLLFYE